MNPDWNTVIGCPRSGTTFLMNALEALPRSEAVIGRIFPLHIAHIVNQVVPDDVTGALERAFAFSLQAHVEHVYSRRSLAIEKFLRREMSLGEMVSALRHRRLIERLIFKEPFFAFAPEYVYRALPKCRIVHIYRDGRDCANSLVRTYDVLTDEKLTSLDSAEVVFGRKVDHRYVPWWVEDGSEEKFLFCTPYVRAVWMWKEIVRRCHAFFSQPNVVDSGRAMLLRYEDLMADPIKWGRQVVAHLGGEFSAEVAKRFARAHEKSIGSYKKRDSKEIKMATEVAGKELERYGYL